MFTETGNWGGRGVEWVEGSSKKKIMHHIENVTYTDNWSPQTCYSQGIMIICKHTSWNSKATKYKYTTIDITI